MNIVKRQSILKKFVDAWSKRGSEKSDAQMFWNELLAALGFKNPSEHVRFEFPIEVDGRQCYIDVWIPTTDVLIEQKSRGIDLDKPVQQSDGSFCTPFEQAKRYADALPYSKRPRWIITCNFDEFRIYDLDRLPTSIVPIDNAPQIIKFKRLPVELRRLNFLVDPNDENIFDGSIDIKAVESIEKIRETFARKMLGKQKSAANPIERLTPNQRAQLNRFSVRLVFCLYAEDASLFVPNQFVDFVKRHADDFDNALAALFKVLDTPDKPVDLRPRDLPKVLRDFPYVNGGLFAANAEDIPDFDKVVANSIDLNANDNQLNWFAINPTIFGALFESNLNEDTRRAGGMHFTSRANILKLIKPLFLDALHDEFDEIKRKTKKNRRRALEQFQDKLASLTFLDPACGSGNFLTETYIKLRELENDVLRELLKFGVPCTIKVSIDQFYGIEINDFAAAIAQTAMWISESKMYFDTEVLARKGVSLLPLRHSARIVCGNALRIDWNEVVPDGVDYIIGNPPFSGARVMTPENKADLVRVFDGWKNVGNLDFIACWFKRAADFMVGTETRAAFVATNSIAQGESVGTLWTPLFDSCRIDFAYRTFCWTSESENPAAVHCVIIGFSTAPDTKPRIIFDGEKKIIAKNINGYLLDAPDFSVERRAKPICNVPPMMMGSMPVDGGNLIIDANEVEEFIRSEPAARKFIRPLLGAEEFINNKRRYCLWLVDAAEDDLKLPLIAARVKAVRQFRLSSKADSTRRAAAFAEKFHAVRQPSTNYIAVPKVSSERRKYIPIGFVSPDVIATDLLFVVPDAELFHFGVLTSSVHMAWMRLVAGRLEISYRYSAVMVYNNFPWCDRTSAIERTAARILEVRQQFQNRSLASLYDESTMPSELRAAHAANDRAVLDAYGFSAEMSEAEIVTRLMDLYQCLTTGAAADKIAIKRGDR